MEPLLHTENFLSFFSYLELMLPESALYLLFITPIVVYISGVYKSRTLSLMMALSSFLLAYSAVFVLRDLPLARWILIGLTVVMLLYHSIVPMALRFRERTSKSKVIPRATDASEASGVERRGKRDLSHSRLGTTSTEGPKGGHP